MKEMHYRASRDSESAKAMREFIGDKNVEPLGSTAGYNIFINKETKELYIHSCDYHAGVLIFDKSGLEEALEKLDQE